jgi:hypothetical protein
MAHDIVLEPQPTPASALTPPPYRSVQIEEQKVFADLGSPQEYDHGRWVLDTVATNHITGSKILFSKLET